MRRLFKWLAPPSLIIVFAACPSVNTMHTAKPITPGDIRLHLAAEANGFAVDNAGSVAGPNLEAGFRYGAHEMFDFGVKLNSSLALTADFNFAFLDLGFFAMSIDPTLSIFFVVGGNSQSGGFVMWGNFFANILIDVIDIDFMALTVAIKPGYQFLTAGVSTNGFAGVDTFVLGGSVGITFRLGDTFRLIPEATVVRWLANNANTTQFAGSLGMAFDF